jgi:hypothetical protein
MMAKSAQKIHSLYNIFVEPLREKNCTANYAENIIVTLFVFQLNKLVIIGQNSERKITPPLPKLT